MAGNPEIFHWAVPVGIGDVEDSPKNVTVTGSSGTLSLLLGSLPSSAELLKPGWQHLQGIKSWNPENP